MKINLFIVLIIIFLNAAHAQDFSTLTYIEIDSLMRVCYNKGDFKSAIPLLQHGLEKAQKEFGIEHEKYAKYAGNLGIFYSQVGDIKQAEPMYKICAQIKKKVFGDKSSEYAKALNNLAAFYENIGKYEEVESLLLEAKEIRKKTLGEEHEEYTSSLNNLAVLYERMGKYEEAELLFLQARDIRAKLVGKRRIIYATSLSNLAYLYESMGRYKEAETNLIEAQQIYKDSVGLNHPTYALASNKLAEIYTKEGKYEEAEKLFLEVEKIWKKSYGEAHPYYAGVLNSLATLYQQMGKFAEAEKLLLATEKNIKGTLTNTHPEYISILNKLAELYLVMNQTKKAFAYAITGVALNCDGFENYFPSVFNPSFSGEPYNPLQYNDGIEPAQLKELYNLKFYDHSKQQESIKMLLAITKAQYLEAKKNNDPMWQGRMFGHYNIAKAAMKLNENYRNSFTENANKLRLLKQNNDFVKYGLEATLALKDPICVEESFVFAEQNKSILLSDAVKGDRARTLGDLPDSLIQQELDLQQKKDLIQKKIFESKSDEAKVSLVAAQNEVNLEIDAFIKSMKDKYPKYHTLKYQNTTVSVKDIQKILDNKTLFLEYFVADTVIYLFSITKKSVELLPLVISKELLSNKIKRFRNDLSNVRYIVEQQEEAYESYIQNASWFYNNLIKKALEGKSVSNLIVVADGELGHLPFEVFLVENAEQGKQDYKKLHYLLQDYSVSYHYSASLLVNNLQHLEKHESTAKKGMLACAASYTQPDAVVQQMRQPYLFAMRQYLQPLPAAISEISALSNHFKGDFLQEAATNEAFFKTNAANYNVIHLAMHGMMNPREPMLSSLAFTENKDSLEDNFLQAYEISRLNLNADLVVLSACETGYGKFQQGEGVMSLARSFMYAGVPSLVVSLWQVNDGSTAQLMQSFYQYLAEGKTKDVALRQAKLDYIQNATSIAAHPTFWSPFIQLGDNSPIKIQQKLQIWTSVLIAFSVLSLIAIVMLYRKRKTKK